MTDLAKLVVRLEADNAKLIGALDKANRSLEKFRKKTDADLGFIAGRFKRFTGQVEGLLSTVGVVAVGAAFVRSAGAALEYGDAIDKAASKAGATAEEISALAYAFKTVDVDIDATSKTLRTFQDFLGRAGEGGKEQTRVLEALGLKYEELRGLNVEAQVGAIADQFAKLSDPTDRARIATDLFGKAGLDLIPLLEKGSAGLADLRAEAERTGQVLSGEQAQNLADAKDSIDRLKSSYDGLALSLTARVAPALTNFFDSLAAELNNDKVGKLRSSIEFLRGRLESPLTPDYKRGDLEEQIARAELALNELTAAQDVARFDAAVAARSGAKPAPGLRGAGAAAKSDALDSLRIEVSARKVEVGELEKLYRSMDEATQTSAERAGAAFEETRLKLEELLAAGRISEDQYNARIEEAVDDALQPIEVTAERIKEKQVEIDEFGKQVARNSVDIIADTLTEGFDGGLAGIRDRFARMLFELSAQAVAADIGRKLFGSLAGGEGGGFLGGVLNTVGGFFGFGGSRDSGGRGVPGMAYAIGTGAQPEVYVPDRPGQFVPAGMLGGMTLQQNFTIAAPNGSVSRSTEMQIGAAAARGVQSANRRNN